MTYSLHLHLQGSDYCYACNLSKSKFRYFNKYFNSSYLKSIFLIKFSRNYLKKINKYNVILFVLNSYHRDYLIQKGLNPKNIKILYNPLVIQKYEDIEYNSKSEFILYAGNVHIYDDHFEQVTEQISRTPYPFPTLEILNKRDNINDYVIEDFKIHDYQHHPQIKAAMRA